MSPGVRFPVIKRQILLPLFYLIIQYIYYLCGN